MFSYILSNELEHISLFGVKESNLHEEEEYQFDIQEHNNQSIKLQHQSEAYEPNLFIYVFEVTSPIIHDKYQS